MDRKSTKYIVLWSAVLSVMALNTTMINAEETPGTVATAQPTVTAPAAPAETPTTTSTPTVAPATPAATPAETPATPSAPAESSVAPATAPAETPAATEEFSVPSAATTPATSNEIAQNKAAVRHGSMKLAVQAQPTGEQLENGHWTYIDETTHQKVTNSFKYLDSSKKTVYYDENGYMVYGLHQINGNEYYFLPDTGAMFYGEKNVDGHYYNFDKRNNGAASTGITDLGYKTVLYADNGQMLYGFQNYNGKYYYLTPGTGAMYFGEKRVNGHYYNFAKNNGGAASIGLTNLGYKVVYYNDDGTMFYGEKKVNGHYYYFRPGTGAMATGLTNLGYKKVYYNADGTMFYGEKKVNGHYYYFRPGTGAMATGLTNLGYKTVYYNPDGTMFYGEKKVNGSYYYFRPGTGAMATGLTNLGYKTVYYDNNGRMVHHDIDLNGTHYFVNPVTGEVSVTYHHGTVPYMKQTDPRWGNRRYGGMTMASTACGVTTIAMNLTAWKGYTILPPTVADYLHSVGEYNGRSAGTTGYSRIAAGNHWSLRVDKITSLQQMKTALAQGKTISEMSGAGYFSNGSHGITIFGNSNGYATAYDPYNSRNNGTYSIDYLWNARSKDPADYDAGAVIFAYYR